MKGIRYNTHFWLGKVRHKKAIIPLLLLLLTCSDHQRAEVLQRRTDAVHRLALVVARVVGVQLVDDQAGANSVRMFPHPAPLDQNLALLRLNGRLVLEPVHPWQWVAAEVALQPNVVARLAADVLEVF